MKKYFVLLLLNFTFFSLIGQVSNISEKIIKEKDLKLIVERQKPNDLQYLKIYELTNNRLIESIKIDNEYDLYNIDIYYIGDRNFAIIKGRYKFFIINLSNNILIGPFRATARGEIEDAQSLVVGYFNIFNNGQYLVFASIDFGVYCYNLIDLYNPVETIMYTKKTSGFRQMFFFLDKRDKNTYNGIVSEYEIDKENIYSRKITSELIFQGYKLKTVSNDSIEKKLIEEKYLVLFKKNPDFEKELLIFDFEQGKILDNKKDNELITRLTESIK